MGDAKTTELALAAGPTPQQKRAGIGPKHATTLAVDRTCGSLTVRGLRAARMALLGVAAAFVVACTTPTLPLPPPTEPSITTSTVPGKVHLHGVQSAKANALVIAFNQSPAVPRADRVTGTQADDAGSWDMDVTAAPKDVIEITQETGDTRSPSIDITVPAAK